MYHTCGISIYLHLVDFYGKCGKIFTDPMDIVVIVDLSFWDDTPNEEIGRSSVGICLHVFVGLQIKVIFGIFWVSYLSKQT